jgi:Family of unknown function (DUF5302)
MLVMPANESDPTETQPAHEAAETAPADDDVKARFRAALEHKRTGGPGADGAHGGGKTGNATSNGKVQRTFRRRAGGG